MSATSAGVHLYDKEIGDYTPESIQDELDYIRGLLIRVEKIDVAELSHVERLDMELFKANLDADIEELELRRSWQRDPHLYVELPLWGCFLLIIRNFAPPSERIK